MIMQQDNYLARCLLYGFKFVANLAFCMASFDRTTLVFGVLLLTICIGFSTCYAIRCEVFQRGQSAISSTHNDHLFLNAQRQAASISDISVFCFVCFVFCCS